MACQRRQETGTCSHHQCEFSYDTGHGYECVMVIDGFCEVGEDCLLVCPYSFRMPEQIDKATKAFKRYSEGLEK